MKKNMTYMESVHHYGRIWGIVVGLVLLVAYTVATKKEWKCPVCEVLERVFYAVALITGVVLMNVHGITVISIVHKISAALFTILLIVCEI